MPAKQNPGGRPRKYANDAEKQRAYRERWETLSIRTETETKKTLERLAEFSDESLSEVVNSLIKFALLNRNWFTVGLFGKRLPRATDRDYKPTKRDDERGDDEQ
jgi:hypothetical protein